MLLFCEDCVLVILVDQRSTPGPLLYAKFHPIGETCHLWGKNLKIAL